MILKLAFLATIVLYVVLGFVLSGQAAEASTMPEGTRQTLTLALGAVFAMQAAFALLVLPRFMAQNPRGLFIVRLAIYESGAIMGLVLTLLTHDPRYTLFFGVPAFLLILVTP